MYQVGFYYLLKTDQIYILTLRTNKKKKNLNCTNKVYYPNVPVYGRFNYDIFISKISNF